MNTGENGGNQDGNMGALGNIVWFEIPADDLGRAKTFYGELFGWKLQQFPGPIEYWHIDTGGPDASPDGGLLKRQNPGHRGITNYIAVASVEAASEKVQKLGGKLCMPKHPVPGMGYFAICQDPEENIFAVWEKDESAK
jgi:predicted enzyme related to lactoylglutathione lyase